MIPLPSKYGPFCISVFLLIPVLLFSAPANSGVIIYVDATVVACGDGASWDTAYKYLQDALGSAMDGDDIWVRAGEYYVDQSCANPDGSGDRDETFQLVKGVFLLAGFDGTELNASERDPVANITILNGAIAQGQDPPACAANGLSCFEAPHGPGCLFEIDRECCARVCDPIDGDPFCCLIEWDAQCVAVALAICGGSYHVVTAGTEIDDPDNTVIDGFTIRNGTANGTLFPQYQGGGMLIRGEPSVVRCTFTSNAASVRGGGISVSGHTKRPRIINCILEDNPGDQALIPTNGGGLASSLQADPILTNCLFVDNSAKEDGGGLHNLAGTCAPGTACGRITLVNCTVASNTANTVGTVFKGGGLYADGTGSIVKMDNCIFWDNSPDQIAGVPPTVFEINYSDCESVCPGSGTGNLDVNPMFVNPLIGDYHLKRLSPVIDKGNPDISVIPCDQFDLDNDGILCGGGAFFLGEPTPDLDLRNRVLNGDSTPGAIVDMGSYERGPAVVPIAAK